MKINNPQSYNTQKHQPTFRAGVTNLYSDFDGTYMPIEWGHDAFCKYHDSPKRDALLSDKKAFQDYFDNFKKFFEIAKSEKGDKFNFTLTTGRNRFEYNFLMRKVRQEGFSMPTPDRFIVNNGGDIFTPVADFFQSSAKEVFPAANFVPEKREAVKALTNGWDGDALRDKITKSLKSITPDPDRIKNIGNLGDFTDEHFYGFRELEKGYDQIMSSDMTKDEIRLHIQELAKGLKEKVLTDPKLREIHGAPEEIDWNIGVFAEKLDNIRKNGLRVLDIASDGSYYEGAGLQDMSKSIGENFAAIRSDSNLGFHINFSKKQSSDALAMREIERTLRSKAEEGDVQVYSKIYDAGKGDKFATIKLLPKIDGSKIDKVIDTKAEVERIIKGSLNDLVITAGDGSNDARMLSFFEYIGGSTAENFSAENLRKIYNLPLISIYVDNSSKGEKVVSMGDMTIPYNKIDDYFNSDGNVRFIHVDPTNPTKPKNLQEALPIAIREYAKRNEAFRDNLPKEMQKLIEDLDYEYPINREISKTLEEQTGEKLWNPAPALKKKVREIVEGNSGNVSEPIKNSKNKIVAGIAIGAAFLGLGVCIYKKMKNKKNQTEAQVQPNNILIAGKMNSNLTLPDVFKNFKTV